MAHKKIGIRIRTKNFFELLDDKGRRGNHLPKITMNERERVRRDPTTVDKLYEVHGGKIDEESSKNTSQKSDLN